MERILLIPLLAIALGASPTEATVRKCSGNPDSSAPFVSRTLMLMIDGRMEGEMPARGADSTPAGDLFSALSGEEIADLSMVCLEHDGDTGPIVTAVISVITKEGVIPLVVRYLGELAALQSAYRENHGRYATGAGGLNFFARRAPVPLAILTADDGWKGSITVDRVTCEISGSASRVDAPRCADQFGNPIPLPAAVQ